MTQKDGQMRKILILLALLCVQLSINAQEQALSTAKDFLKQMPEGVIPILTHNNVLDMLDFISAGQKAEVTNRMNGKSEMTQLSTSSASISLCSTTRADLHLMPCADNKTLIYLISTTETADSLRDSVVKVYDSRWQLAGDEYQIKNFDPRLFNDVKINTQTKSLTMQETQYQLVFDGESSSDTHNVVRIRHAVWDENKGIFKFTD